MRSALIVSASIVLILASYSQAMPVEGDELHQNIGGGVPHPSSQRGQELSGKVGGGVPYPQSPEGQALSGNSGDKSVLEGGTQVKPWLKNQPNINQIRKEHAAEQNKQN
ncbi:hypothetical protein WR25_18971 [Diploscapter pachys]|uniref:Secreted protein n=1 Tax=Diploscapter pachys TaxID=2018661 RepID=A0A2A2LZW2_9BILA|nr:hypothetical protein WR25_18971 [Diploscapter pachys]